MNPATAVNPVITVDSVTKVVRKFAHNRRGWNPADLGTAEVSLGWLEYVRSSEDGLIGHAIHNAKE